MPTTNTFPTTWSGISGAPFVTVSSIGLANGAPIANNGCNYGPDTPGTSTKGQAEASSFLASHGGGLALLVNGQAQLVTPPAGVAITTPYALGSSGISAEWSSVAGVPCLTVSRLGTAQGYPTNNYANFGPDTAGTSSSGLNEAFTTASSTGVGAVELTAQAGQNYSTSVPVVIQPGVSVYGYGSFIQATATGFVGSYVVTDVVTGQYNYQRFWDVGVDANSNAIDGFHVFGSWGRSKIDLTATKGGGSAGTAFALDNSTSTAASAGNDIWIHGQIGTSQWVNGVYLVGNSTNQNNNNIFWEVNITNVSGVGFLIYQYADTNTFKWARCAVNSTTAIGVAIGTAGTSSTPARCDRTHFDYLDVDVNGTATGYTCVQLGYYSNTNGPGYFSTTIGKLVFNDNPGNFVQDLRSPAEGGTGAVSDWWIGGVVQGETGQAGAWCNPVSFPGASEIDDPTGDRNAADGSAITLVSSAAFNQWYEVDLNLFLPTYNSTTGTVNYTLSWTDWAGTSRTQQASKNSVGVCVNKTFRIYVKAASAVTVQVTASGTWTTTTAHARCRLRQQA